MSSDRDILDINHHFSILEYESRIVNHMIRAFSSHFPSCIELIVEYMGDLLTACMHFCAGNFLVSGLQLGNVWIGVQPALGVEGDPMRLLFERDLTPHPQYAVRHIYPKTVLTPCSCGTPHDLPTKLSTASLPCSYPATKIPHQLMENADGSCRLSTSGFKRTLKQMQSSTSECTEQWSGAALCPPLPSNKLSRAVLCDIPSSIIGNSTV